MLYLYCVPGNRYSYHRVYGIGPTGGTWYCHMIPGWHRQTPAGKKLHYYLQLRLYQVYTRYLSTSTDSKSYIATTSLLPMHDLLAAWCLCAAGNLTQPLVFLYVYFVVPFLLTDYEFLRILGEVCCNQHSFLQDSIQDTVCSVVDGWWWGCRLLMKYNLLVKTSWYTSS